MDRADRLLQERERDYQGALHIGRNDAKWREQELNNIKEAFAREGLIVPGLEEHINNEIAGIRRVRRDITSEGSQMFEDDLRNHGAGTRGSNLQRDVLKTESDARRASQPIPGTEAHHPASVSSTESLVQNMNEAEVRKLWNIARSQGYTVGSEAKGFIPLSKPAHTTGGKNWGNDFAHVGKDGTPDTGRFKVPALPKGTRAVDAWKVLKPVLDEQRTLNERAYNHPTEQLMRQRASEAFGAPLVWDAKGDPKALATQNANAKAKGINATTISKNLDRYPDMQQTGAIPGVNTMVPGARVPLGMGKPDKPVPLPKPPAPAQVAKSAAQGKPTPEVRRFENRLMNPVPKPVAKPAVKPVPKPAAKSAVKPVPKPAAKPVTKDKPTAANPGSASQQIRRHQNAVPDAIHIHPGMSLPSHSLIQGI
jgi:hypothetical protein